jgi:TM2 domain-containing membrane protein YozV
MNKVFRYVPEATGNELFFLEQLMANFSDEQAEDFSRVYRTRRMNPNHILIATLAGFFVIAGIQRFMTKNIGLGILYLLTAGLCFIGTIVDLVNYQNITFEYNRQIADEIMMMMRR